MRLFPTYLAALHGSSELEGFAGSDGIGCPYHLMCRHARRLRRPRMRAAIRAGLRAGRRRCSEHLLSPMATCIIGGSEGHDVPQEPYLQGYHRGGRCPMSKRRREPRGIKASNEMLGIDPRYAVTKSCLRDGYHVAYLHLIEHDRTRPHCGGKGWVKGRHRRKVWHAPARCTPLMLLVEQMRFTCTACGRTWSEKQPILGDASIHMSKDIEDACLIDLMDKMSLKATSEKEGLSACILLLPIHRIREERGEVLLLPYFASVHSSAREVVPRGQALHRSLPCGAPHNARLLLRAPPHPARRRAASGYPPPDERGAPELPQEAGGARSGRHRLCNRACEPPPCNRHHARPRRR